VRVELEVDLGNCPERRSPTKRAKPDQPSSTARLIALAHHFDCLLRTGRVKDMASLARMTGVSRARISQIMDLIRLAPEIQKCILSPPKTTHSPVISARVLRLVAKIEVHRQQLQQFNALLPQT